MKGNAGDTIVKKIDLSPELVRVALYIRVSGEEQKIKGLFTGSPARTTGSILAKGTWLGHCWNLH